MNSKGTQPYNVSISRHVSIFPQTPLPFWLPNNLEQSSLCSMDNRRSLLFILNTAVCTCHPKLPNYPFLPPLPSTRKTASLFLLEQLFNIVTQPFCHLFLPFPTELYLLQQFLAFSNLLYHLHITCV